MVYYFISFFFFNSNWFHFFQRVNGGTLWNLSLLQRSNKSLGSLRIFSFLLLTHVSIVKMTELLIGKQRLRTPMTQKQASLFFEKIFKAKLEKKCILVSYVRNHMLGSLIKNYDCSSIIALIYSIKKKKTNFLPTERVVLIHSRGDCTKTVFYISSE